MKKRKQHELVAFVAIWAVQYQKDYGLDGLHPTHYDLIEKYGGRMDSFTRATNAQCPQAKSMNPHPADGMTQHVDCGDGAVMEIIDPRSFGDGGPEYVMRYGNPNSIRYAVASLLSSYDYLLSGEINMMEATRRLRLLRAARKECLDPVSSPRHP